MQPSGHIVQPQVQVPGAQVVAGPTTVHVQQPVFSSNRYNGLHAKAVLVLSGLQLGNGIFSIAFQIAAIIIHAHLAVGAYGIWCGFFFLLAGSFGFWAGKSKTLCSIITFMVFSIIAAVLTTLMVSFTSIGLVLDHDNYYYYYYGYGYYGAYYSGSRVQARVAMNSVLIFLAVFEAVIAIISASLCCHAICCCRTQGRVLTSPGQSVQFISQHAGQSGPVVFIQGQPGVVYQQQAAGYPVQGHMLGPQQLQNQSVEATAAAEKQQESSHYYQSLNH